MSRTEQKQQRQQQQQNEQQQQIQTHKRFKRTLAYYDINNNKKSMSY